jgi:hypothetical protein
MSTKIIAELIKFCSFRVVRKLRVFWAIFCVGALDNGSHHIQPLPQDSILHIQSDSIVRSSVRSYRRGAGHGDVHLATFYETIGTHHRQKSIFVALFCVFRAGRKLSTMFGSTNKVGALDEKVGPVHPGRAISVTRVDRRGAV